MVDSATRRVLGTPKSNILTLWDFRQLGSSQESWVTISARKVRTYEKTLPVTRMTNIPYKCLIFDSIRNVYASREKIENRGEYLGWDMKHRTLRTSVECGLQKNCEEEPHSTQLLDSYLVRIRSWGANLLRLQYTITSIRWITITLWSIAFEN